MKKYNLQFIRDEDLFEHVKCTVLQYCLSIDLQRFHENLMDPVSLALHAQVGEKEVEEILASEVIQLLEKSRIYYYIDYFHKNIFRFIGGADWQVSDKVYDIIHLKKKIFVKIIGKRSPKRPSFLRNTYIKMQSTLLNDENAVCLLVDAATLGNQDKVWFPIGKEPQINHETIRQVSIDKFYAIVTGDALAFKKLCEILPRVIEDVVNSINIKS